VGCALGCWAAVMRGPINSIAAAEGGPRHVAGDRIRFLRMPVCVSVCLCVLGELLRTGCGVPDPFVVL
jgi:hypothetical protein